MYDRRVLRNFLVAFLAGAVSGVSLLGPLLKFCIAVLRRRRALLPSSSSSAGQGKGTGASLALPAGRERPYWDLLRLQPGGRRPVVCVTGSGSSEERRLAESFGDWCARSGCHVLTGGGGGVMTSVSRAFAEARTDCEFKDCGLVLAVLPGLPAAHASEWATAREEVTSKLLVDQSQGRLQYSVVLDSSADEPEEAIVAPRGYPNEFVDVAVRTHLPSSGSAGQSLLSRNHISVLSADVIVALPGGRGTASQVELALNYGVPVCRFLGTSGTITGLSEASEAASPAFADLAAVQAFVFNAIASGLRKAAVPTQRFRGMASQGSGLDQMT
ncbi:unnamed protein product [Polarella glacialis]|uniref:Cytokinin riboside 5'-monophosphate phosphoribohydrolase n=1 Tax=Polarella glacialis TaxID=89957 RepID=A0A813F6E8_POLGL|nr:unnamed protein product [Polarella glacialis]